MEPRILTPPEKIREIWEEMKLLKFMRERTPDENIKIGYDAERAKLETKYENTEILFGHESTLSKAIIFYLSNIN